MNAIWAFMNVNWAVPILLIIVLIFFGAIAGVVALLINRRTRVIGLVLLAAGLLLPLVLAGLFFGIRAERTTEFNPVEVHFGTGRGQIGRATAGPGDCPDFPGTVPQARSAKMGLSPSEVPKALPAERPPERVGAPAKDHHPGGVVGALGHAVASVVPHKEKPAPAASPAKPAELKTVPAAKKAEAVAAPERPDWVAWPAKYIDDAYVMPVSVGPYTTELECDARLPDALQAAVADYVEIYLGPETAASVRLPADELRKLSLARGRFVETIETSLGPMVQLHAQLAFDTKVQEQLREQWRQAVVAGRLRYAAGGLAVLLSLLALLFAYLKTW